jgi:soluble lytic murein transglycosylase-like protein
MSSKGFLLVKTYRAKKTAKIKNAAVVKNKKGSRCDLHQIKKRAAAYKHTISMYSKMYNVDQALVMAIIKNESCFKVNARSRVGAIGLMQLMPSTAKYLQVSNPWNPKQNIQGGVKYIAEMLRMFKGNKRLALAAYNAGPANVRKHKGIPPFKETRTYVARVMSDYKKLKASGIFSL